MAANDFFSQTYNPPLISSVPTESGYNTPIKQIPQHIYENYDASSMEFNNHNEHNVHHNIEEANYQHQNIFGPSVMDGNNQGMNNYEPSYGEGGPFNNGLNDAKMPTQ